MSAIFERLECEEREANVTKEKLQIFGLLWTGENEVLVSRCSQFSVRYSLSSPMECANSNALLHSQRNEFSLFLFGFLLFWWQPFSPFPQIPGEAIIIYCSGLGRAADL